MSKKRPFTDLEQLQEAAVNIWRSLNESDWRQAFAGHPAIGQSPLQHQAQSVQNWSEEEQAGMSESDDRIRQMLAAANLAYQERFGYTFIVCASGKSADEMLGILIERLSNEPDAELKTAARQQELITEIRLRKWLK